MIECLPECLPECLFCLPECLSHGLSECLPESGRHRHRMAGKQRRRPCHSATSRPGPSVLAMRPATFDPVAPALARASLSRCPRMRNSPIQSQIHTAQLAGRRARVKGRMCHRSTCIVALCSEILDGFSYLWDDWRELFTTRSSCCVLGPHVSLVPKGETK